VALGAQWGEQSTNNIPKVKGTNTAVMVLGEYGKKVSILKYLIYCNQRNITYFECVG